MNPTLADLFRSDLRYLVSTEEQMLELLNLIKEKVETPELKKLIEMHRSDTEEHITIATDLCDEFSLDSTKNTAQGMRGIVTEAQEAVSHYGPSPLLDLTCIEVLQRAEHYLISAYGTVTNYVEELGYDDVQDILHEVLSDAKAADEKLTAIAEVLIPHVSPRTQNRTDVLPREVD